MYTSMKNYFAEEILLSFKILHEEEAILTLNVLFSPFNLDLDHTAADSLQEWCGSQSQQNNYNSSSSTGLCVNHETC